MTSPESSEHLKFFEKCGTPCYIAPEILRGEGYSKKCDIFSIGSVMFNMLTGQYLFAGSNANEMLFNNRVCNLFSKKRYVTSFSKEC
jgi:calcium/calmodulin-dependent protein kinase I